MTPPAAAPTSEAPTSAVGATPVATIAASLQFTLDTAAAAEGTVTFDDGGTVTTTASDGSTFELTVPPRAAIDDTLIRMTPLTDVQGIGGGPVHAVRLEPEGLVFYDFVRLTIRPAIPIAVSEQVMFQATGDGNEVTAALVDAGSEPVVILAQHFSIAGTLYVEAQVAALYAYSAASLRLIAHKVGVVLQAERKRQMAGEAETPGVWDEVSKLLDQAERDVLTPLRIAAAHKCEATQKYIQTLISLEKLRLLAGLTNDAFSSRVQQEVIRATDAAFPVCEREAIEKCRAASDPSILVKFWITFDRQRSLRGLPAVAATGDFMARARRMCVDADQFEFSGSGTAIDHGQPVPITWHYWGLRCPDDETWRIWEKFDGVQQTVNLPPGAPQGPIVVRFDTNGAITSSVWPPLGNVPGTLQGTKLTLSPGDEPTQVIATINEGEGPPIAAAAPIGPADDLLRHCGARAGE